MDLDFFKNLEVDVIGPGNVERMVIQVKGVILGNAEKMVLQVHRE
jgi:hypothetical protein